MVTRPVGSEIRAIERAVQTTYSAELSLTDNSAAIIEARQPAHLTGRFFQHLDGLPMSWAEQEQLLLA